MNEFAIFVSGIIAAVFVLLSFGYGYRKRAKLSIFPSLGKVTIRHAQWMRVISACVLIGLIFAAFSFGISKSSPYQKTGVIAYMCDESRSMGAQEGTARIERCKSVAQDLDAFPYSIVAMYGFTERAFSHSSFSGDHSQFQKTVERLVAIEAVPGTGSEIGFSAQSVIEDTAKKRDVRGKKTALVILLSDGESTSRSEQDDLLRAVKYAKKFNVRILTIGIGGNTPKKIPLYEDGVLTGVEKDDYGAELVTKLNETTLRYLAEESGGLYVEEHEIEKAKAYIERILAAERIESEGGASKIASLLTLIALVPLAFLFKYSRI